ncbi:bulb-type lectin domain-containing protein [Penicillium waksmanii]|uniref:bulb-type lectin domain-containing protein n=1 Tax=Penicillium waksmanii TaxID=69791 RepID=UPI00254962E4|nr:bulb-type lectin domain-containing protein [Penicillium waksmanii]KAJ5974844.1 bulb-type lectin domain-containing protein [Penicillium waksmanii]
MPHLQDIFDRVEIKDVKNFIKGQYFTFPSSVLIFYRDGESFSIDLAGHVGNDNGAFCVPGENFHKSSNGSRVEDNGGGWELASGLREACSSSYWLAKLKLDDYIEFQDGQLVFMSWDIQGNDEKGNRADKEHLTSTNEEDAADEEGPETTNRLNVGQTLELGDRLVSDNGEWTLLFQSNGNLVLYSSGSAYWQSNTTNNSSGTGSFNVRLEEDGNFVVAREGGGRNRWESESNDYGAITPYILVQDYGDVCLYDEEVEGCHWSARDI